MHFRKRAQHNHFAFLLHIIERVRVVHATNCGEVLREIVIRFVENDDDVLGHSVEKTIETPAAGISVPVGLLGFAM